MNDEMTEQRKPGDPENTFKNHWKTIKSLRGKKRLEFILEYYKLHLAIAALILAGVIYAVVQIANPPHKTFVSVAFYGAYVPYEASTAIAEDINEAVAADLFGSEAGKYTALIEGYDIDNSDYSYTSAVRQKFAANLMLHDIDIIITTSAYLESLSEQGIAPNAVYPVGASFAERYNLNPQEQWSVFTLDSPKHPEAAEKTIEIIKD